MSPTQARHTARTDLRLSAQLGELQPLLYADGGAASEDRPAYVRAASAVRRSGDSLLIVQDDVNVLALRSGATDVSGVLLPTGYSGKRVFDDGRGNKAHKMDLEACAALPDGRLLVFGSGSSSAREGLVVVQAKAAPRLHDAAELYAHLRARVDFAGSELNVEGALVVGAKLWLFQRGNGAERTGAGPVNAIGELALPAFLSWLDQGGACPVLADVRRYDLGTLDGVALGFTDAAWMNDGRIAFLAAAERSPDATRDGDVVGCCLGILDAAEVRMTRIIGHDGAPTRLKLEGIESRPGEAMSFDVVADMDRPELPAELVRLEVSESAGPRR